MSRFDELVREVEELPTTEKWQLVKLMLRSLEQSASSPEMDWHQFLRATYGSLRDTPIERWDQGEYEQREPFE